jgi:hypothetical protein
MKALTYHGAHSVKVDTVSDRIIADRDDTHSRYPQVQTSCGMIYEQSSALGVST